MVKALHWLCCSSPGDLTNNDDLQTRLRQFKACPSLQCAYYNDNAFNINRRLNPGKQFTQNTVDTPVTSWLPHVAADPREVLRRHIDTNYIQLLAIDSQPGKEYQDQNIAKQRSTGPAAHPGTLCVPITRRHEREY
jgi:hypothetical protein